MAGEQAGRGGDWRVATAVMRLGFEACGWVRGEGRGV